ncbi:amino acid adenylation domain-containing protein [Paucibacter sp. TC2R-5]|uniref:non-ribosomal peptide synthetase n=1 Tax=Paucibacter sp. TC2R-5 TaxID=2893555 RepID=UPI0021E3C38E|nr:amino acid adenylation domain-containing protein [Paucibacter sp. TC2R-5]MCV2358793.1 amino acid adenylation domain-containing protein [Paucibacter sp. TC2R-5]
MSLSQREVWLDQRAWPGSTHLHIGGAGFLVGPLDVARLQQALLLLVARHAALRLAPHADGTQCLLSHFEPQLDLIRLDASDDPRESMRAWWQQSMRQHFELDGQPPWRFTLLRANDLLHGLTIQFHHLVMDGWGTTQVMRAWSEIYAELGSDSAPTALPAPSYQDFIAESVAYRSSVQFERDASYWQQQLGEHLAGKQKSLLDGALIASRQSQGQGQLRRQALPEADVFKLPLPRPAYDRLAANAEASGSSVFACFLAAVALYYARLLGRSSLLIGVPSLNRSGRRYRATPGMFVGVLAVRVQIEAGASAADLLRHVSQQIQGALRHPRYPLSELSHSLQLMRAGRDSLLDLVLSFERQDYALSFGAAQLVDSRQLFAGVARYPLALTVCEFDAQADPEMIVEASQDCFGPAEPQLLARRLWHLTQALAEALALHPNRSLEALDIVPSEERWALLEGLHKDLAQLDAPQAYIDLFEHQAALWPQRCALVWDGGSLSYGELAQRVEMLARRLRDLGAARNKVVALAIERGPEMVTALLAISRACAAFLPLDPQAPTARLAEILADSGAVALLLDASATPNLAALHSRCLPVRVASDSAVAPSQAQGLWATASPDDLAYVLFTSGSSGRPKGVMVEHGALSRRLAWLSRAWAIDANDRSAQGTQLVFDPALIELLLPLTQGASIALPPPGKLHPQRLADFMLRHGTTFSALVPSSLPGLLAGWHGKPGLKLRVACCGGEVLAPELAARFVRETGAQLFNVYGPTEATIFATSWDCTLDTAEAQAPEYGADLPLGRPIDDSRIYVLGPGQELLPFGAIGEIYIGGGALARGYVGRPDLDQQAFMADPFAAGQRIYRSGDRGWLDVLGRLHFSGRIDRQIKLRGYRIEPGDVEAACCALPGIEQAVVQKIELGGQAQLHAWLVGRRCDTLKLQAGLRMKVPDYMRPSGFTWLDAMPLTGTGKLDCAALPLPLGEQCQSKSLRPPATAMEHRLLALWQQALSPRDGSMASIRSIGMDDDFFELGGDSLAALSILGAMEDQLGRPLPLQLISEHPSIASLARVLSLPIVRPGVLHALSDSSADTSAPAPALFLAASGHGDVLRLKNLAQSLQGDTQLFMLQAPLSPAPATMEEFASLYADCIEAQTQTGDQAVWLAGFSVGGVTALATALELQKRGRKPLGLMLLDTIHPDAVFGGATSWRALGWLVSKLHMQDLSMNGRRLSAMFSDPGLISQVLALRGHRCHAFTGPVLLVKSTGLASWNRFLFQGWHRLMPQDIQTRLVSGLHGSMFEAQHVNELAETMRQFLLQAQGENEAA